MRIEIALQHCTNNSAHYNRRALSSMSTKEVGGEDIQGTRYIQGLQI